MQNSIISIRPNSVFTAFNYVSQPCSMYALWNVVYKETEAEEGSNPIGVVIQIHDREELRADMYGNVCYSEIRPATYTEIAQYRPELLEKLVRETYLIEIDKETAEELFGNYTIYYDNGSEILHRSWWSDVTLPNGHTTRHKFPETTGKYYLLKETYAKITASNLHPIFEDIFVKMGVIKRIF